MCQHQTCRGGGGVVCQHHISQFSHFADKVNILKLNILFEYISFNFMQFLAHLAMPKMSLYDHDLLLLLVLALASVSVDSLPDIFKMAALL